MKISVGTSAEKLISFYCTKEITFHITHMEVVMRGEQTENGRSDLISSL